MAKEEIWLSPYDVAEMIVDWAEKRGRKDLLGKNFTVRATRAGLRLTVDRR